MWTVRRIGSQGRGPAAGGGGGPEERQILNSELGFVGLFWHHQVRTLRRAGKRIERNPSGYVAMVLNPTKRRPRDSLFWFGLRGTMRPRTRGSQTVLPPAGTYMLYTTKTDRSHGLFGPVENGMCLSGTLRNPP